MSADLSNYNLKNSAVKRILQEVKELRKEGCKEFIGEPVQDNIFEWHFAIRGPDDSEFEGGIYHGRILLPPDYPFKPPTFMMLTPNGRFEVNTKICLSISQHHPEHWQPSWSVRTALVALRAFMPTPGDGAIGSLDYAKDERVVLARKSRTSPPNHGGPDRQLLIQEVHDAMLEAYDRHREEQAAAQAAGGSTSAAEGEESPAAMPADSSSSAAAGGGEAGAEEHGEEEDKEASGGVDACAAAASGAAAVAKEEGGASPSPATPPADAPTGAAKEGPASSERGTRDIPGVGGEEGSASPSPAPLGSPLSAGSSTGAPATPTTPLRAPTPVTPAATPSPGPPPLSPVTTPYSSQARISTTGAGSTEAEERRLSMIAAALVAAIVAILWRKTALFLGYSL